MRQWEPSHGESGFQGLMWMVRVGVEMKSKWDPENTEKSENLPWLWSKGTFKSLFCRVVFTL